jgi:hypothetical protein
MMACAAPGWPAGWGPCAVCGPLQGTVRGYNYHWRRKDLPGCWPACGPSLAATREQQRDQRAGLRTIKGRVVGR